MATRVLHVSDLHFGKHNDPTIERAIATLVERVEPELVIASGDLTHRGQRDQHEHAAAFLKGLGTPVVAVPGNHDIPYTLPGPLHASWVEFEREWETTEPVYRSTGSSSSGSTRCGRGAISRAGSARRSSSARRELLREARRGALRVVMLHHHLIGAPWRSRKKPVARRNHVLARLVDAGAELILAGHIHQAAVSRAARVRGLGRRRARRGRLDRARARPAAPEPARRGARPPRLRGPTRARSARRDVRLARGRLGADRGARFPRGSKPLAVANS